LKKKGQANFRLVEPNAWKKKDMKKTRNLKHEATEVRKPNTVHVRSFRRRKKKSTEGFTGRGGETREKV